MSLLEAETDFGLGLLRESSINSSFVFSPLSIALALSLVHAGAKANTGTQIGNALLRGAKDDEVQKQYTDLSKSFTNPANGVEVNLANRVYIRNGFHVQQSYLDTIKKNYGALAQNLDFSKKQEAAKVMNDFVKETTKGKITDLVKSESVSPDTIAFLINALYIKADWKESFQKTSTREGDFFEAEGKKRKVQFMSDYTAEFDYSENADVQVVSLKYKDASYAFNIFLPKEKFGIDKFRAGLTGKKVQELLGGLRYTGFVNFLIPKMKIESDLSLKTSLEKLGITDVFSDAADLPGIAQGVLVSNAVHKAVIEVKIPKTKIETDLSLKESLEKLGITDAFSNDADLSGIATGVRISDAVHKTVIEVDEDGTTASAATHMEEEAASAYQGQQINFFADHPFLFVLTKNNQPLFIGTQY